MQKFLWILLWQGLWWLQVAIIVGIGAIMYYLIPFAIEQGTPVGQLSLMGGTVVIVVLYVAATAAYVLNKRVQERIRSHE